MPEPDVAGGGFSHGGARPSGPSWMTGGLSFDTSGIKTFTTEVREAAKAVKALFDPFTKVKKLGDDFDKFFAKLKLGLSTTAKAASAVNIGGDGGGGGTGTRTGNGGTYTLPSDAGTTPTPRGSGGSGGSGGGGQRRGGFDNGGNYRFQASAPTGLGRVVGQGIQQFRLGMAGDSMSVLPGARRVTGPGTRLGPVGGIAAGVASATLVGAGVAAGHVDRQLEQMETSNFAAFQGAQSLGGYGRRGYLSQYDVIRYTGYRTPGMFASAADRSSAAGMLFNMTGMSAGTPTLGGGNLMQSMGALGLADPRLTGGQQAGIQANLLGPMAANMLLSMGINVSPGGRPRSTPEIFNQMANRLFRGNPTTQSLVQNAARPGTGANLALMQMVGGDQSTATAFLQQARASAQLGRPVQTDEKGYAADLKATGIGNTLEGTGRALGDIQGIKSMTTDIGAIDAINKANKTLTGIDQHLVDILKTNQGAANTVGKALGYGSKLNALLGFAERVGGGVVGGALPAIAGAIGRKIATRGGAGVAAPEVVVGESAAAAGETATVAAGVETVTTTGLFGGGAAAVGAAAPLLALSGDTAPGQDVAGFQQWPKSSRSSYYDYVTENNIYPTVDAGAKGRFINSGIIPYVWRPLIQQNKSKISGMPVYLMPGQATPKNPHPRSIAIPTKSASLPKNVGDPVGGPTLRGPGHTAGMQSSLLVKLAKMFQANAKLVLTSGFRTRAEQTALYQKEPGLAAPPGQSKHERGLASDVSDGQSGAWLTAHAQEFGLYQPMPGKEPWHLEETGAPAPASTNAGSGGKGPLDVPANVFLNAVKAPGLDLALGGLLGMVSLAAHTAYALGGGTTPGSAASGSPGAPGAPPAATGGVGGQVLSVGQSMGATPRALLAAFEAGIVESGMRNLPGGDRDSAGVFQQRPSQGWGTYAQVTDVAHAAMEFFQHAAATKTGGTAGSLAQSVQRSAFPARYDQVRPQAVSMLSGLGVDVSQVGDPTTPSVGVPSPRVQVPVGFPTSSGRQVVVQNLTIKLSIGQASYEEADRFVQRVRSLLTDEDELIRLAGS